MKKHQEIKELSTTDLVERLAEAKDHLVKMKLNHAVSSIENPYKIKEQRRTIARMMTELRARELNEKK
ncbi:MAG: 50S ribosomal protein L29 [Bacteroidales bacterium]|nr:50S ribosomal protein L29 [Bacteroidales bacterium]MBQ7490954.1 50S ribosomal protein L29 [Bacteroidales bacterium]